MVAPFDTKEAFEKCLELIKLLDCGKIELKQIAKLSTERSNDGIMIGCAVCTCFIDGKECKKNLFALSGLAKELFVPDFFKKEFLTSSNVIVPPVVSAEQVQKSVKKNDEQIHLLTEQINLLKKERFSQKCEFNEKSEESLLRKKRLHLCDESLKKVFSLYSFTCSNGKTVKLTDICKKTLPPTGTGDCCAPKLLNYAYSNCFRVVSMAETFYGKSNSSRKQGELYAPCDERCGLILPTILGLHILYKDDFIAVVNKPSGLLSVPGRGPEKQDCVVNRLKNLYSECIEQPAVHRLDMETSGLMVLALTKDAHRELNRQFENREVYKEYTALIDGKILGEQQGCMKLYFRLDVENRPHQIWDEINGKEAITQWQVLGIEKYFAPNGSFRYVTRIRFIPHTGRTHQLRLAASDSHGFGIPIVGDSLYGKCGQNERLMLHSHLLEFTHPITKKRMKFENPAEF